MKAFAKFDGREDIKYLVLWSLKKLKCWQYNAKSLHTQNIKVLNVILQKNIFSFY